MLAGDHNHGLINETKKMMKNRTHLYNFKELSFLRNLVDYLRVRFIANVALPYSISVYDDKETQRWDTTNRSFIVFNFRFHALLVKKQRRSKTEMSFHNCSFFCWQNDKRFFVHNSEGLLLFLTKTFYFIFYDCLEEFIFWGVLRAYFKSPQ